MSKKEDYRKYLLKIFEASNKRDLKMNTKGLEIITGAIFKLTQSLFDGGEKLEFHNSELENKFFRYGLANHSIIKLLDGLSFELIGHNMNIIDIFSIKSIVRMQIESYLIMFYLFFDNVTVEEKNLRYAVYKLHGLRKQASFAYDSDFAKKQYQKVQIEISETTEKIIKSAQYKKATSVKERNKLLKPSYAIMFKKEQLFERSDLNKSRISDMWSLYSNYAHAEHISDRQFNTYYKSNIQSLKEECVLSVEINLILSSKLALYLANSSKSSKKAFKDLTIEETTYIETWGKLHE
ncbi:hypothetical protein LB452_13070 [Psychroflexus sp. CAK8W]|uniref:Uncharacterized protein n=1 Tax=Psychroflexus longus TaxID=2873596 RepID=A0ABS7XN29_9FLAO|nr:hypothetical protein [Psychroflexus longus]MBZ9779853.1 hypothetical protein [Psychroflexus longus]